MPAIKIDEIYYTYDDYKNWEGDWELINGMPYAMAPAPVKKHQSIASAIISNFYEQLDNCLKCEVLGKIDYKISEDTVVRPDVVLTCDEENEAYLTKTPEIIVEIASKNSVKKDEIYKFSLYEAEKVKYYVIVYPEDLRAKIFKQNRKRYEKVGDFFKESYFFEDTSCKVSLDFDKVFKRLRKQI